MTSRAPPWRVLGRARNEFATATTLVSSDADHWHHRGVAAQRCSWQQPSSDDGAEFLAEARRAWKQAVALEPHRTESLSLLRLASNAATSLPSSAPAATRWTVGASGAAASVTAAARAAERFDGAATSLEDLTVDVGATTAWRTQALQLLQRNGALRTTSLWPVSRAQALADALGRHANGSATRAHDTSSSTLAHTLRRHVAVSLRLPALKAAFAAVAPLMLPLLCDALHSDAETTTNDGKCELRIVESGLLTSLPGAVAQPLHTDTPQSTRHESQARVFKVQLGAMPIAAAMGPTEVVPASVEAPPASASDAAPLSLPLPQGSAVVYDTRSWHRGGANTSPQPRPLYYFTVIGKGAAPSGLPYTIQPDEVACFLLTSQGLRLLRVRRCRHLRDASSAVGNADASVVVNADPHDRDDAEGATDEDGDPSSTHIAE